MENAYFFRLFETKSFLKISLVNVKKSTEICSHLLTMSLKLRVLFLCCYFVKTEKTRSAGIELFRSSHQWSSVKKGVLGNFAKFTGKPLCQSLFFNKVAGFRPEILLKKRLWHRRFPGNFAKFLRTPFFTEDLWTTASNFWKLFELSVEIRQGRSR